jgi:23S rRNA pseudouridine2605 synthase
MAEERLQKLLSQAGFGSRRACEEFILQKRVRVNGQVAELGAKADPERDEITLDGEPIARPARKIYVAVNKPEGVVTTNADEFGRKTVRELVPLAGHLYPVGRLDFDSEGLVLLTNDGELANVLTHPRFQIDKEYNVLVTGQPDAATLDQWRAGVVLFEERTAPARVDVLKSDGKKTWLSVTMHEGRKRQIREVAGILGHPVEYLRRVRLGPLRLGDLKPGQWRYLSTSEVRLLRALLERGGRARGKGGRRAPGTVRGAPATGRRPPDAGRGAGKGGSRSPCTGRGAPGAGRGAGKGPGKGRGRARS